MANSNAVMDGLLRKAACVAAMESRRRECEILESDDDMDEEHVEYYPDGSVKQIEYLGNLIEYNPDGSVKLNERR